MKAGLLLIMIVSSVRTLTLLEVTVILLLSSPQTCRAKKRAGQDLEKYFAASTEDTAKLFQLEKDLWELVLTYNQSFATAEVRACSPIVEINCQLQPGAC